MKGSYTNEELSRRLLNMGVPARTADMYIDDNKLRFRNPDNMWKDDFFWFYKQYTPAWSAIQLMYIMDVCLKTDQMEEWPRTTEMLKVAPTVIEYLVRTMHIAIAKGIIDFDKLKDFDKLPTYEEVQNTEA